MNRLAKYVPRCPWRSRRSYQLHQPDSFILSPLWIAWLEHENIIASRESLCLLCTFSSCSHLNGALQFTVQLFGLARNNESISCALLVVSFTNTVQTSLSLAVSSKYRWTLNLKRRRRPVSFTIIHIRLCCSGLYHNSPNIASNETRRLPLDDSDTSPQP